MEGIRDGRRVLNMGRVASEQVDDGQLRSGEGRGPHPFWKTLGVQRDPGKKKEKKKE